MDAMDVSDGEAQDGTFVNYAQDREAMLRNALPVDQRKVDSRLEALTVGLTAIDAQRFEEAARMYVEFDAFGQDLTSAFRRQSLAFITRSIGNIDQGTPIISCQGTPEDRAVKTMAFYVVL